MEDYFSRLFYDLLGRIGGPLSTRLWLQPTMATIFAIRDGLKDAKAARSPYFYALFTEPDQRRARIRDGLKSLAKVLILALILDTIYQVIVFHWVYPFETLIVANVLAVLPYLMLRGTVNRIWRLERSGKVNSTGSSTPD